MCELGRSGGAWRLGDGCGDGGSWSRLDSGEAAEGGLTEVNGGGQHIRQRREQLVASECVGCSEAKGGDEDAQLVNDEGEGGEGV